MPFPIHRMRRYRKNRALRRLFEETRLAPSDFVLPLFVAEGLSSPQAIASMPGVQRHSFLSLVREASAARSLGIPAVLLFGIPKKKDGQAREAFNPNGVIQKAVRLLKREVPDLAVITDVCACEYTSHGHCGILAGKEVDNDKTLALLSKIALSHAAAGADMVAPSDMMDGRIAAIRKALDGKGYIHAQIMSYAAKYASAFYNQIGRAHV